MSMRSDGERCHLNPVYPLTIVPCGRRPLWFDVAPQLPTAWLRTLTTGQLAFLLWAREGHQVTRVSRELARR